jgi:hypothetical protein
MLRPLTGAYPICDADEVAPSLYAGRGGSRRRPTEDTPGNIATQDGTPEVPDSGTIDVDNSAGLPVTRPFTS